MFLELTNHKTGRKFILNFDYVDEIQPHESGEGVQIWSAKPGVRAWHAKESYDDISARIMAYQNLKR